MTRYGVDDAGPGLPAQAPWLLARLDGRPVGTARIALDFQGQTSVIDSHWSTTRLEFKRRALDNTGKVHETICLDKNGSERR